MSRALGGFRGEEKPKISRSSGDKRNSLHPEEPCPFALRDALLLRVKDMVVTKEE